MPNQDEYCLLFISSWATCMTKSEWSAWVQTVGVFIAAFLALFFPAVEVLERRKDKANACANDRYALNELRQDVVHFVGPLLRYVHAGRDLIVDDVHYESILKKISYFDLRLQGAEERKLLALIRRTLRSVDSYRRQPRNEGASYAEVRANFTHLHHSAFNPEIAPYFFVHDEHYTGGEKFVPVGANSFRLILSKFLPKLRRTAGSQDEPQQ